LISSVIMLPNDILRLLQLLLYRFAKQVF